MPQPTAQDVAQWMLKELQNQGELHQDQVVYDIADKFGKGFTYLNESGNHAIGKDVLAAFLKLTGKKIVWIRSERYWRERQPGDEPGRNQPY